MNTLCRTEAFARKFYTTYYSKHYSQLLQLFTDEGIWSGFHAKEPVSGKQNLNDFFRYLELKQKPFTFHLNHIEMTVSNIRGCFYSVNVYYQIDVEGAGIRRTFPVFSSLFLELSDEFKICQVFFSLLGTDYYLADLYKPTLTPEKKGQLERVIHEKDVRLQEALINIETLYNSVPGGIFKCLYDENLTLLDMSDGFLSMIGYTRNEVHEQLNNSLRKIIVAEDITVMLQEVEYQLSKGHTKEIQYRLIHKDGHYINVLDKGTLLNDKQGRPSFYCIIVDVTQEKIIEEELQLSLERYQIIMNQTNDVIFDWDLAKDSLTISNNYEKKFGKRHFPNHPSLNMILKDMEKSPFAPKDSTVVYDIIRQIREGKSYIEREIRLRNEENIFIWCRCRITLQYDSKGNAVKAIGILTDIDQDIRKSINLRRQAEQDALTGIYNKMAAQSLIRNYIQKERGDTGVLMIIDIDNFKLVNDTKGHLYGDEVLSELAGELKHCFRDSDILGRIGGDEFIIFLKGVGSIENAIQNADKILHLFSRLKTARDMQKVISCSIGITLYPGDGKDFNTLYQKADQALYQAKHNGKNQYAVYNGADIQQYLQQYEPRVNTVSNIDSDQNRPSVNTEIAEYVFRILYNTDDIHKAISIILEIIGRQYDVSRAYIFENSENNLFCSNTFEWCNEGIEPQIKNLQHLSYEEDLGGNYNENYDENNIFYCPDITKLPKKQYELLAPQNIKSMLQCAITDKGIYRGIVGFDECRKNRYWTQEQINALTFISEILCTFLLKQRAVEKYGQENMGLLSVLNNQSAWIYVIEPETYKLLFINRKTYFTTPGIQLGMHCHKIFMNCPSPCETCPVLHLNDTCANYKTEFYNPYMHIWSDADASYITWKGEKAILVCCHDINKFKNPVSKN